MILLIAYGNPLRQDDGAGLRLAELMAERWQAMGAALRHVAVQQLTPELAVEIAAPGVTAVVLVDTRISTAPNGAVEIARLAQQDLAAPSLGHHFQPQVLMAYATLLLDSRAAPPAWLVTAPGVAFDHGEGLSEMASAAIEAALSNAAQPFLQWLDHVARHDSSQTASDAESRAGANQARVPSHAR